MRRLLMFEEHKARKREFGFGRIETAAEMDEKRFRTQPRSRPVFLQKYVKSQAPTHP